MMIKLEAKYENDDWESNQTSEGCTQVKVLFVTQNQSGIFLYLIKS